MSRVLIPGGLFKRFIAILLDGLLIAIPVFGILYVYNRFVIGNGIDISSLVRDNAIIFFIPRFIYLVYFEQSKWQATLGKQLFSLKVSDSVGKRISLKGALGRNVLYELMSIIVILMTMVAKYLDKTGALSMLIITIQGPFMIVMSLIWFLPMLFTKNKTGTYEILSRTRVIKQEK